MSDAASSPDSQQKSQIDADTAGLPAAPRVIWEDSKIVTSFANVVNVLSTREEMALLFGTNQTWNALETKELVVQLSNRIVLTPYAAKRLMILLTNRVREYESRYGTLNL
jgi:hypothetical protein